MKNKIFDCITFFDNNFMFDFRYNILKNYVDYFIICESKFDHKGNKKDINFIKNKKYDFNKVKYFVLNEPFPKDNDVWRNQAIQREFLLNCTEIAKPEDYIFFSDPDEIPKPELLINFKLKKKYGIFLQKFFVYKINIFNKFETPWQGTRICKKKYLKSITFLRKKIRLENLKKAFWKFQYKKSIESIDDGGWHFNNLYNPEIISKKLKNIRNIDSGLINVHTEINVIKEKILNLEDVFYRNHKYQKIEIDNRFPKYIRNNLELFKDFILE